MDIVGLLVCFLVGRNFVFTKGASDATVVLLDQVTGNLVNNETKTPCVDIKATRNFVCSLQNVEDDSWTLSWIIGDKVVSDVPTLLSPSDVNGLVDQISTLDVSPWLLVGDDSYLEDRLRLICKATSRSGSSKSITTLLVLCSENYMNVVLVGALGAGFVVCVLPPCIMIVVCLRKRRLRMRLTQPNLNDNQETAATAAEDGGYLVPSTSQAVRPKLRKYDKDVKKGCKKKQHSILLSDMTVGGVYNVIPKVSASLASTKKKEIRYDNVGPNLPFPRDRLIIEGELGSGAFGTVLLGTAIGIEQPTSRTKVAVKTLKEGADRLARTELLQELELMKKIPYHHNVVGLLGYCIDKDPIYVIVEYLAKGDLKKVLIDLRSEDAEKQYCNQLMANSLSQRLIGFARDVACGMAFLASQKCIHRDLAARNVLVGDDMECKVSDFGLARDVMNIRVYQRQSQGPLPMRWMALESVLDDVYTTESDVWSFGILLWEIVTLGARPYPLMSAKRVLRKIKKGYRMPIPNGCKDELYKMMLNCWHEVPSSRPSFQSIYEQLTECLNDDQQYIAVEKLEEPNDNFVMTVDMMEKF